MSSSLLSLLAFSGWTVLLITILVTFRVGLVVTGKKKVNSFLPDGSDIKGFGQRLTRAYLNNLEFLPVLATVIIVAHITGHAAITDGLAMVVFYARICQSVTHVISISAPMIMIRATFFSVQLAIVIVWLVQLLKIA